MEKNMAKDLNAGELEQFYNYISDASEDGFKYVNYVTNKVIVSNKYKEFFGVDQLNIASDGKMFEKVFDEDKKYVLANIRKAINEKLNSYELEYRIDNGRKWISHTGTVRYDENGNVLEKLSFFKDVTEIKEKQLELERMAYYDNDTGAYNRNYFVKRLQKAIDKIPNSHNIVQVLYIDIDNYNIINDIYGFSYGDEVICKFAKIINEFTSHTVKVGRFNNDEFAMALFDAESDDSAIELYKEIIARLEKPITLTNGREVYISISVGIAKYCDEMQNATDMIRCADIAMFNVKQNGKNNVLIYENCMMNKFVKNVQLEHELKSAVENLEFILNYQPQFYSNQKFLRGVEALLRWQLKDGKFVSPAEFIPMAEKNGTIVSIGTWVIKKALEDFAEFKEKYSYDGMISINISAIQLKEKNFSGILKYYTEYYNLDPEKIEIEITESVLIEDSESTINLLKSLRDFGFKISLDDFGTGYSSLSYLRDIPINTLKIDKSFVDTMLEDESTSIITDAVIKMVKKLGLETIAEGVETEEQFEYLMRMNCDNIQGYLLGRPMPKEELVKIILEENKSKLERSIYG
ncbi:MAG: GGDEF domain-containing protein [Lachnospiraceae bacterium]|nr:GGDEF domain-containing protein [Lachnospiraceae bacterium]